MAAIWHLDVDGLIVLLCSILSYEALCLGLVNDHKAG
jgi:hypothetical protein